MKKRNIIIIIAALIIVVLITVLIINLNSNKFTVTFDTDGGSAIKSVKVKENETVTKPTDPTKDGYNFLGWYLDNKEYDFNTKVTKDIILVASWSKITDQYNIKFTAEHMGTDSLDMVLRYKYQVFEGTKELTDYQGFKLGDSIFIPGGNTAAKSELTSRIDKTDLTLKDGSIVTASITYID